MISLLDCANPVSIDVEGVKFLVRCGKCPLCELKKKSEWTVRLEMEAAYHDFNTFVTLTYNDTFRPRNGIDYRDVQLFLKRLRKRVGSFRFFCANEYGSSAKSFREHAHIIFFGLKCNEDLKIAIAEAWPYGFSMARGLTSNDACCNYTCGYVDKKSESFLSVEEAEFRDYQYNVLGKHKPYVVMSRRPGIGYGFYEQHKEQMRRDFCFYWRGRRHCLNPYFVKLLKAEYEDFAEEYVVNALLAAEEKYNKVLEVRDKDIDEFLQEHIDFGCSFDEKLLDFAIAVVHKESVMAKITNLRRKQEMFATKRLKEAI